MVDYKETDYDFVKWWKITISLPAGPLLRVSPCGDCPILLRLTTTMA